MEAGNLENFYISENGAKIRVHKRGTGKKSLILIHGLGAFIEIWEPLMKELEDKFTIYAPDLPGHGETVFPASEMTDFYRENSPFFKTIDMLIEKENISSPILAGNSMGGGISMAYSVLRRDVISGCILIDPLGAGNRVDAVHRILSFGPVNWYFRRKGPDMESIRAGWNQSFSAIEPPEWLIDCSMKHYENRDNWQWYFRLVKYGTSIFGLRKRDLKPIRSQFAQLPVPKLVIWGRKDRILDPVEGKAYFDRVENTRFIMIPDGGHVPMVEYPGLVAREISTFAEGI